MTRAKVRGCERNVKRKSRRIAESRASYIALSRVTTSGTPVENSDRRKSLEKFLKASQNSTTFFIAEQLFRQPPVF
jgi:hypothetical protein